MYELISSITNETYNQILEAINSNEKKELFASIFKIKKEESTNNTTTFIRILSKNEYNKYIINGTLDGSITAGHYDVWNDNEVGESYEGVYYLYPDDGEGNQSWDYVKQWLANPNFVYIGHNNLNKTYNINYETLSDNTGETNQRIKKYQPRYDAITLWSGRYNGAVYNMNISFNKNETMNKNLGYKTDYRVTADHVNPGKIEMNFNLNSCFRPVFQFLNNQKSNNIFS